MSISLFWQIQVENFDTWLNPDAEGLAKMFAEMGVLNFGLHRNIEDPNSLMMYFRFADIATMRAFEAWYEEAKKQYDAMPGAKANLVRSWIGQDVEGYSR